MRENTITISFLHPAHQPVASGSSRSYATVSIPQDKGMCLAGPWGASDSEGILMKGSGPM